MTSVAAWIADSERDGGVACAGVERGHESDRVVDQRRRCGIALDRRGDDAEADRLREHECIAGLCAPVAQNVFRVDGTDDRHAVLRLRVVDRVSAGDDRAGFARDRGTTVDDACEELERQSVTRPRHEVQREQRRAAHRVHVRERVRRGDAAPVVRVVDDRREEVGRDDDREVGAHAVDRGIVGGVEADEQVRVRRRVEPVHQPEDGTEVVGRELAGATGAVRELGESDQPATRPNPEAEP